MNTACKSLLFAVPALLLGACASSGPADHLVKAESPRNLAVDYDYVTYVESVTRSRGVKVVWINPPTKRDTATQPD